MVKKRLITAIMLLLGLCFLLTSCGDKLNEAQKEIKIAFEQQKEDTIKEYDERIAQTEKLKEAVASADTLEEKKQLLLDAGYDQEDVTGVVKAALDQMVQDDLDYLKTQKEDVIKMLDEEMQKAIDEAK